MTRKILVTGGGGFLGGAIVRKCVADGDRVISFARKNYPWLTKIGVEQIQGDLQDLAGVEKACKGVAVVFHTAAKAGVWGPRQKFYGPNVEGTRHVIAACRKNSVQRLIYTSSPSVVFDGSDQKGVDETAPYAKEFHAHYPATKAMAEKMVRRAAADGLPAIALRPHLIWGPGDTHLTPRILAGGHRLKQIGDGTNTVDTIYIDNAAHAHLLADKKLAQEPHLSGRVYFISQDKPVPVWWMINAILAAGGKPPIKGRVSVQTAKRIGAFFETVYRRLGISNEPPLTRFVVSELSTSHWFDISAAKKELGYRPEVSIKAGLKNLAHWLRSSTLSL